MSEATDPAHTTLNAIGAMRDTTERVRLANERADKEKCEMFLLSLFHPWKYALRYPWRAIKALGRRYWCWRLEDKIREKFRRFKITKPTTEKGTSK